MFNDLSIEVNGLNKTFRLYHKPADRLRELLFRRSFHKEFKALEDISFFVSRGESLGIIGDNGAGKSTLLKILAGTLTPTSGSVRVDGRAAALLELGAGFHPEFTGRQNIYLNASLMGLTEAEIKEREQDIIEFSELGKFIDQPVKTYSSGMYLRLAFSIATSVDPEILIIDEALSVGDQYFQQKCIKRMASFKERKKTIVFCSHSMYLVQELCNQALWLNNGRLEAHGDSATVVGAYLTFQENRAQGLVVDQGVENGAGIARKPSLPEIIVQEVLVLDSSGKEITRIEQFQEVTVRVKTRRPGPPLEGHLAVGILRPDGQLVFGTTTKEAGLEPIIFSGEQITELRIPSMPLLYGCYQIKALATDVVGLICYSEKSTEELTFHCERPELGVFWIDHHWKVPGDRQASASLPA